jgi:signal peptidase I
MTQLAPPEEAQPPSTGRALLETLIAFGVLLLLASTLLAVVPVPDDAMSPTLDDGQWLMTSQLTYQMREPERGEIVLLADPQDRSRTLVRRVVGLPGETVELRGVQVAVNNRPLIEPYVTGQLQNAGVLTVTNVTDQIRLGPGEYFVLSDNRRVREDSRVFGPVRRAQFDGRAWLIVFPFERLRAVDHAALREVGQSTP